MRKTKNQPGSVPGLRAIPGPQDQTSLFAGDQAPEAPPDLEAEAVKLWEEQEAARKRLNPKARGLSPSSDRLRRVKARIRESGVEACRHVLAVYEAEARGSGDPQYFNGSTNWRPENFDRALAKDPERALAWAQRRSRTAARSVDVPAENALTDDVAARAIERGSRYRG